MATSINVKAFACLVGLLLLQMLPLVTAQHHTYWVDSTCEQYPVPGGQSVNLAKETIPEVFEMAGRVDEFLKRVKAGSQDAKVQEFIRLFRIVFKDHPLHSRTIPRPPTWGNVAGPDGQLTRPMIKLVDQVQGKRLFLPVPRHRNRLEFPLFYSNHLRLLPRIHARHCDWLDEEQRPIPIPGPNLLRQQFGNGSFGGRHTPQRPKEVQVCRPVEQPHGIQPLPDRHRDLWGGCFRNQNGALSRTHRGIPFTRKNDPLRHDHAKGEKNDWWTAGNPHNRQGEVSQWQFQEWHALL